MGGTYPYPQHVLYPPPPWALALLPYRYLYLTLLPSRLSYPTLIGGIQAFWKKHYVDLNGYSNKFWGWGGEDDNLFTRLKAKGKSFHWGNSAVKPELLHSCISQYKHGVYLPGDPKRTSRARSHIFSWKQILWRHTRYQHVAERLRYLLSRCLVSLRYAYSPKKRSQKCGNLFISQTILSLSCC